MILLAHAAQAGQSAAESLLTPAPPSDELPFAFDGPPPPVAPGVISRDQSGRATIRAVRLMEPLRLDGRLDEAVYASVPPITDFIQQEPVDGAAATEKTELWVFFDRERFYVTFRCWESRRDALVANEMRHDNLGIFQNDHVAFIVDSFYDRRNGA